MLTCQSAAAGDHSGHVAAMKRFFMFKYAREHDIAGAQRRLHTFADQIVLARHAVLRKRDVPPRPLDVIFEAIRSPK